MNGGELLLSKERGLGTKQDKANCIRRVEARSLLLIVTYIGEFIT